MKNIVITGSTKGIGRGLATAFAERGMNVVVTAQHEAEVKEVAAELEAGNRWITAVPVLADVTDFDTVQNLWTRAVAELGTVDMWINNAGLAIMTKDLVDNTPDEISRMIRTNMMGTVFGTKVAATGMLAQPTGGRIVNILGGGSEGRIQKFQTVYSSTKRGLDLFTKAMVKELKGTDVKVQSVRPGILITDGFVREIGVMGSADFAKWRKTLSILGDNTEDVTPWLADRILAMNKSGQHVQWLTNAKIARRFATAPFTKRDIFSRFGV